MKKKKQKQRLKDMEKRSSEKGMDLMEAYTEKPVKEEVNTDLTYLLRCRLKQCKQHAHMQGT